MSESKTTAEFNDPATIVNRLRGIYRIPIRDGLGATGGGDEPDNSDEFVRSFPTVPIQHEAAREIERLRGLLTRWVDLDGDRDDIAALIIKTRKALS